MITAAVITSSIGRAELRQCIESVRAQTHPARHYVFVNGTRWHEAARQVLCDYPDVTAFFLPEETGDYGQGPSMADVFAAAPFLTRADWVFYLDDDNFYDPNHVESVLSMAREHDLTWVYALRRWVDKGGDVICDDDWDSLGHHGEHGEDHQMVDNSCFSVSRRLAQQMSLAWTLLPFVADRCFFHALKKSGVRAGCTGLSTVNYRIGTGVGSFSAPAIKAHAKALTDARPGGFPWRKPAVF